MDALEPFVESIAGKNAVDTTIAQVKAGVETTKCMKVAFVRAVYVEESALSVVPDPEVVGVLGLIEGFAGVD
jgi:hypothetical protein